MKTDSKGKMILGVKIVMRLMIIALIYGVCVSAKRVMKEDLEAQSFKEEVEVAVVQVEKEESKEPVAETTFVEESPKEIYRNIVYDNMTIEELSAKLDRSLNSTLSGQGYLFATKALELGVDPYLAVAIVLEETGCKWDCSNLVKQCNNVGGQKGGNVKCNGGSYRYYATLEEGIIGFIDNLARNFYAYGLTTAEQMNPKYAASREWASKVNNYIAKIKAS